MNTEYATRALGALLVAIFAVTVGCSKTSDNPPVPKTADTPPASDTAKTPGK